MKSVSLRWSGEYLCIILNVHSFIFSQHIFFSHYNDVMHLLLPVYRVFQFYISSKINHSILHLSYSQQFLCSWFMSNSMICILCAQNVECSFKRTSTTNMAFHMKKSFMKFRWCVKGFHIFQMELMTKKIIMELFQYSYFTNKRLFNKSVWYYYYQSKIEMCLGCSWIWIC